MSTASQSFPHKLALGEVLQLMVQDGMVLQDEADKLAANRKDAHVHPLAIIAEQQWHNQLVPNKILTIEVISEWLAGKVGMAYFHVDPLKLNFGGIASIF